MDFDDFFIYVILVSPFVYTLSKIRQVKRYERELDRKQNNNKIKKGIKDENNNR